jgi:cytochrome b
MKKITVWDLPLRLFHWLLVACVATSFITIKYLDNIDVHYISGLCVMALILFRLLWGFVGSTTSKFAQFFPTPKRLKNYLFNSESKSIGHSPVAAFAVFAFLISLTLQAVTGLFMDDEIAFTGPLNYLVDTDTAYFFAEIHAINQQVLLVLIGLHLCAIAFYFLFKKDNLVLPMILGKKKLTEKLNSEGTGHYSLVLLFLCLLIAIGAALSIYNH